MFVSFIIIFLLVTPCIADDNHMRNQENIKENLFLFPLHFYRKYISGSYGDRCPMHPSCSKYSLEAFQKHGILMGWIMTCDRLMRCGRDELKLSPPVMSGGKSRTRDSLTNNDFWWDKSGDP